MVNTKQGATYPAEQGVNEGILSFAKEALSKECFDAILMTAKMPKNDSFAHMLIADETLLGDAYPLCPVMPIQGARVISSLTGHGKGKKKIGVLVRPCEARATIELAKLGQVDLENITIITMDCPGVIPLSDYFEDAGKADKVFEDAFQNWNSEPMRPVCQICDKFSSAGAEDLHIGIMGAKGGSILLIPRSLKGEDALNKMGLSLEEDVKDWEASVNKLTEERKQKRNQSNEGLRRDIEGIDRLLESFSACINCHNCMRVCPICYCRQCHFDSDNMKFSFDDYLTRAEARGGLTIPTDTFLFHIGRMLHMSLSCVSCGMCEDACPMAIPVAQVFTLVGDRNQEAFDYVPGRSVDEPLPLKTFKEEEFLDVEQSYTGVSARQENQND
jgi:formate dehydrogenase subunit beta